jgi:hypothetical protein
MARILGTSSVVTASWQDSQVKGKLKIKESL